MKGQSDKKALTKVHELSEAFQYYLLKASNKLAQEKGKCDYFDRTKYADGFLPIDQNEKRRSIEAYVGYNYKDGTWRIIAADSFV